MKLSEEITKIAQAKGYTGESEQLLIRNWLMKEHDIFIEVKPMTVGKSPYFVYYLYYNSEDGPTKSHSQVVFADNTVALLRGIEAALELIE
jgi:hypothetical protein